MQKKATELLRLADCLDNIDNDVSEQCLAIMPKEGNLISISDLMESIQKMKRKWIAEAKKAVFDDLNDIDLHNPCMKCGSVQCAICGGDILDLKKKHQGVEGVQNKEQF